MSDLLKNLKKTKTCRGIFQFLLWQLGYYNDHKHLKPVPQEFCYPNSILALDPEKPTASWINHSTFHIKIGDINILTDPIWNERCSPLSWLGPKRAFIPKCHIHDLPPIDLILISHNHYDHLDLFSLRQLIKGNPDVRIVVPEGVKKWFLKKFPHLCKHVIELSWHQMSRLKLKDLELEIYSVPAQHFSGRSLFDLNKTLWMGIVVRFYKQNKKWKTLYFAGDTGYEPEYFKEIGLKYGPMDLSLLPIGVYSPREFMKPVHINPEESVTIHQEVNSKLSIGGHFGTFKLSNEDIKQPPYDLYLALQEKKISPDAFRVLESCQKINW